MSKAENQLKFQQHSMLAHPVRDVDKLRNIWLTARRSLIKRLISGDLGWGHELWAEVDIWNIWHSPVLYCCTALLVHTFSYFYDVSFKCWWCL